jgi:hypothetical protein
MLNTMVVMAEARSDLVGVMVTPSVKAEIERIAKREDRSVSWVGSALWSAALISTETTEF